MSAGAALALALALEPIVRRVPAEPSVPSKPAKLSDIEHVVIMMQENRSFDHVPLIEVSHRRRCVNAVRGKVRGDPAVVRAIGDTLVLPAPCVIGIEADAAAGNLPQVSWLISPVAILEHPVQSTPPRGENSISRVLAALTAKRSAWAKTVLIITFDENGGFFDHVTPPLAPSERRGVHHG